MNKSKQTGQNYIAPNTDNGFCMTPPAHVDVVLNTFNNNKEKILLGLFWYLYTYYNTESKRQNKVCPFFVSMDVLAETLHTQKR